MNKQHVAVATPMVIIGLCALFMSNPALAASSSEWISGGVQVGESVVAGLLKFAGPVLGIGIIAYGISTLFKADFNIAKLAIYVVGGLLITVGPMAITALLNTAG
jgi:hypothetical protein